MPVKRYFNGENKTRLYSIWANMKTRCYNPKTNGYQHYGGKGILVCDEWQDFERFAEWAASSGYSEKLEIDREDASKNYCPENCRWATRQQQVLNSSSRVVRTLSPFKGVNKLPYGTYWRAQISVLGKKVSLGCFPTAEDAAKAYDKAAKSFYGIFARPNF